MSSIGKSSTLKKLDNRIRMLLEDGARSNHRTLFIIIGDKAKDQVPLLHYMLGHASKRAQPTVVWCYKKELGFSSHRKKRMREVQKKLKAGHFQAVNESSYFDTFVSSSKIQYCYYSESQKILGQTFDMCVLQDFEAITPNLLARTIETVSGGGVIAVLVKSLHSLRQLAAMVMDVHARLRTEAHANVVPRFNERFLLSLANNHQCLVMTDRFDVLPLSTATLHMQESLNAKKSRDSAEEEKEQKQLETIKQELPASSSIGSLIALCKTTDQARALMHLAEVITEETMSNTCAVSAPRGRGKSAVLGLATANAVVLGYSNIFITSPAPENVKTLFEFLVKGLQACGYEEHMHFTIVERKLNVSGGGNSGGSEGRVVVRLNIFRSNHRQTVQYIQPHEHAKLTQAELVVVDEAAAIPLPIVRQLIGPYIVFLSSTVNGYEGTGRSLSLKLIDELRRQSSPSTAKPLDNGDDGLQAAVQAGKQHAASTSRPSFSDKSANRRVLREIELKQPIRYAAGDAVEAWLNDLLCLNVNSSRFIDDYTGGCPPAAQCELYYVNKDALFSYHATSEQFLHRLMSLMVASHYKNTPDDLQIIADAPAHHVFCLLPPVQTAQSATPDILCVIQVALEGEISRPTVMNEISRGRRSAGDLIPWTVAQQFQDDNFPQLSGARIVRVAVHPSYQSMGYGSRAVQLLKQYYEGAFPLASVDGSSTGAAADVTAGTRTVEPVVGEAHAVGDYADDLTHEKFQPRTAIPPLLQRLHERRSETLQWLGVSYGITPQLSKFWKRSQYIPVYIRQTTNDVTGEHTCIMLRMLNQSVIMPKPTQSTSADTAVPMRSLANASQWLREYYVDFRRRFISLLGGETFRDFAPAFALNLLNIEIPTNAAGTSAEATERLTADKILNGVFLTKFDVRRLSLYANNMTDYHVIMDLLPVLARLKFAGQLSTSLSALQEMILIGVGLQYKSVDSVAEQLNVPASQLMGMFNKTVRKLYSTLNEMQTEAIKQNLAFAADDSGKLESSTLLGAPLRESLDAELESGAKKIQQQLSDASRKARKEFNRDDAKKGLLEQYSIKVSQAELTGGALGMQKPIKGFVSVKRKLPTSMNANGDANEDAEEGPGPTADGPSPLQVAQPAVYTGVKLPGAGKKKKGLKKDTDDDGGLSKKKKFGHGNRKNGQKPTRFGSGNKMFSSKKR